MIVKYFIVFVVADLIIAILSYMYGQVLWLVNIQISIFSSLFVTLGAFIGYRNNILHRSKTYVNNDEEYDEIDKMDDPYDLYSPQIQEQKELNGEQIKQIIKENKPKGNNIKNFLNGFSGMASVYRMTGYIFLIIGFFI